jgi:hypothetical protein
LFQKSTCWLAIVIRSPARGVLIFLFSLFVKVDGRSGIRDYGHRGSATLSMRHPSTPLSTKVGTNFSDKRRSLLNAVHRNIYTCHF